ncbi:hypothetical protein EST38_g1246 [Candolleomyces aberdarensis]|uniref:F-box domain-containing protein n=1 Tax=Candolleomyces aberdarensis TaxID=2316362 RepID=A0A4Q2DXY2_9AGAR|nr:hypothetical protein EST38_g1246 [Candolleomyces aberdarensis]
MRKPKFISKSSRSSKSTIRRAAQSKWLEIVPNEIWSQICELLPHADQFAFMLIARRLHDIGAYEAYKSLVLHGARGRQCCVSLACGSNTSTFYLSLIRDLTYYALESSDRHLSFPVFSRILPHMPNIHTLNIHIAPHMSGFFMYCMDRRIIKEPNLFSTLGSPNDTNKILSLPWLHKLILNGNTALLPLAPFQNLTYFEMTLFNTDSSLANILQCFDTEDGRRRMRSIRLRFHEFVDIAQVAEAISTTLPYLEAVVLEQPFLNVKDLLQVLIKKPTLFLCMRRLHLNITDQRPRYWKKEGPYSRAPIFLPLLGKIKAERDEFSLVTFGRVGWLQRKGKFVEVDVSLFKSTTLWYGNTFLANSTIVRVCCQLSYIM